MTPARRKYFAGIGSYEAMLRGMINDARIALKEFKHQMSVGKGDKWHTKTMLRMTKYLIKTYKMGLPRRWPQRKLKPCPFCGADEASGIHIETIWDDKEKFRIMCENCGAEIGDFKTLEQAVETWNRRVE